jgi:Spy/CpxP family protein refolding chaperone
MTTKSLRLLLPVLCAGLLLPAAVLSAAENERPPRPPKGEQREKAGDRLADALGLSEEQKAKMKEIGAQERAELEALRNAGQAEQEDRRAKAQAIREKYRAQRDAILTPEQRTKAAAMREKWEQRGERKGKGPGRAGKDRD